MGDPETGLSQLDRFVYGTMRLDALEQTQATELLCTLLQAGVRRFHSSDEYASFGLFSRSLAGACGQTGVNPASLRHVVKLASPHFDEHHFDAVAVRDRLERYATALGAPCIAQVQWMARIDLKDEPARLALLEKEGPAIAAAAANLRKSGIIEEFGCFPYTVDFAKAAIQTGAFDVFIDYYNPWERDAEAYADMLKTSGISFMALRPFAAGKGFEEGRSVADLLDFAEGHPTLDGVIAGTNFAENFRSIQRALGRFV